MIRDLSRANLPADHNPELLGAQPFLLRPGHFSVIDGDTIWALAAPEGPHDQRRQMSFSMRFRSIAAPEKPVKRATDHILQAAGINPYWDSRGQEATELLKTYTDGRAILVEPTGRTDKYGRMLCDIAVVPYTGHAPDISRAISLEHLLLDQKKVDPFRGESAPPLRPQISESPDPFD